MRDPKNDVETFIIDKFSEHGVDNIYGDPKEQATKSLDLIDTTIQTFLIKNQYFFVIYGFKNNKKKLQNGQFGQSNLCLYIYKVDKELNKPDFDKPVFQKEDFNNITYDYCLYKNYQPIIKFNNSIYYMQVTNEFVNKEDDKYATIELFKFDMGQDFEANPNPKPNSVK